MGASRTLTHTSGNAGRRRGSARFVAPARSCPAEILWISPIARLRPGTICDVNVGRTEDHEQNALSSMRAATRVLRDTAAARQTVRITRALISWTFER